jgi:hypothetical protein
MFSNIVGCGSHFDGGSKTMTFGTQDGAKLKTVYLTAEAIFAAIP